MRWREIKRDTLCRLNYAVLELKKWNDK